jgi:hypothetical protein
VSLSLDCRVAVLCLFCASVAAGQEIPSPTPTPAPASLLDQIGGCVASGKLNVSIDLLDGLYSPVKGWVVETRGAPGATLKAEAAEGKITRVDATISRGQLLISGKGLRPKVFIEALTFEEGKGITQAKFKGKGIWRPIVGIFRGVAMSAVRKLDFNTDISSVLRGEILGGKVEPSAAKTASSPATPASPGPSFLDLVGEVRVEDSALVAFPARPLDFGEMAHFQTAARPKAGVPLRLVVDRGLYRPGHAGAPSSIDLAGRLDGEVEEGAVSFGGSRVTFSQGALAGGRFRFSKEESGASRTELGAASFALELTSGDFHLPGGPEVDVEPPSRVAFRNLEIQPDGNFSGLLDADLRGRAGRIVRGASRVAATDIHLHTEGTRVVNGRADGDLDLEFAYRVDYLLVVHYPMKEVGERKVPLVFQGPFTTRLHLENAGKETGTVTGDYAFKVPWPPVEQAALEVLKEKWSQDVTPAIRKVDFNIEPRRFAPCGDQCFLLELGVTAEKKGAKGAGSLFRQVCEPQGKAELVVDSETRSFLLKNVRIEPRCKGMVGWVVNLIAPLLTKTYTDVTLFQMPESMPFTIEKVGSGVNWLAISGKVAWEAGAPAPAAAPQ